MTSTSDLRPDGASTTIEGRVKVCNRRTSRDSVGAGLQYIYLDSILVRVVTDLSDL